MIKAIAFTCYPVSDMAKSRNFYENVLGLKPAHSFSNFWQEYDLGENTFGLAMMNEGGPECFKGKVGTGIAFEVDDLAATHALMNQHQVPVVFGPEKFPACSMFVVADPDQNLVTFHQLAALNLS